LKARKTGPRFPAADSPEEEGSLPGRPYGRKDRAPLIKRVRRPESADGLLLIPLVDHRWIVEGRCALPFGVPEDDDEVDFEAVEGKGAGLE